MLALAVFVTGTAFAQWGAGQVFSASRSANTDNGRFWSDLYTGPWGFVGSGLLELSLSFGIGRIARQNRWCFLITGVTANAIWRAPASFISISPLLGVGLDIVPWARYHCLRSDYTLSSAGIRSPLLDFSAVKLMMGFGGDYNFSDDMFFRTRLLGYYGVRMGRPSPRGGTLRLGVGGNP